MYANIFHYNLQDPLKLAQIAIFGLKIYHLATLLEGKQQWFKSLGRRPQKNQMKHQ
jgi:hypothetical protein